MVAGRWNLTFCFILPSALRQIIFHGPQRSGAYLNSCTQLRTKDSMGMPLCQPHRPPQEDVSPSTASQQKGSRCPSVGLGEDDEAWDPEPREEHRSASGLAPLLSPLESGQSGRHWNFPGEDQPQMLMRHQGNEVAYYEKSMTLWRKEMNNCKGDVFISDIN